MNKYNLLISTIIFLYSIASAFAGNYTWTGDTSTTWALSHNWNPNGIPSTNDSVTITNHINNPVLAGTTTIKRITMTSGTLDCNGNTLTISALAAFNGGAINNGTVTCSGTSTLTFAGTTFGADVNATGNNLLFNGSTFNSTLTAVKKGSTSDNGAGGNKFNGAVTLIDSGTGNLVLGNTISAPDSFNAALTVSVGNTGAIFIGHQSMNNYFSDVTCNTGGIVFSQYGTSTFAGNVVLNSTSNRNITFGLSSGSCNLASGKTVSIGGSGFSAGTLTMRGFVQNGTSPAISLALSGSATLEILSESVFNTNLNASAPVLSLSNAKFYGTDSLTHTGGGAGSSSGCYYAGSTYISNTSSTNLTFTLGNTVADTFVTTTTINESGLGTIAIKNGLFKGTTLFKNSVTGTLSNKIFVATSGTVTIKAALTLDCVFSGMTFGSSGGTTILDTSATLSLSNGFAGELKMNNVEQHNTTPMSFSMTTNTASGNNTIFKPGTGCIFNGNFSYLGQRLQLNGATFNGVTRFTRFNPNDDASAGGNTFNGTTYITDSVINHIHNFTLAVSDPDDYNGNVTFKQYGTSSNTSTVLILPAYTQNSTFSGNVTVDGTSAITFGSNGGKVILDGGIKHQALSKAGSFVPVFKKIQINSHNGVIDLSYPLSLSDTLFLTSGVLSTDATNLLTIPDGKVISGGTDTSYIYGPVKKVGDDAFTFPLGDTTLNYGAYHPLSIPAPTKTTAAYTAQYFAQGQSLGSTKVDSIGYISTCEYWTFNRTADTCQIKPTLTWNTNSCNIDTSAQHIAYWNSTRWESLGKGTISGTPTKGSVSAANYLITFGTLTLAQVCKLTARLASAKGGTICSGITDTITATPSGLTSYQFFKNNVSVQTGSSDKYISSSLSNGDVIKVKATNIGGCFSYDSLTMTVNSLPSVTLSIDSATFCKGQTHTLTASGTGLISYSWNTGATTASINVSAAGTYICNASNGTCNGSNSRVIALYDTTQPTITVIGSPVICTGTTTADLQASLTGAVNYLWSTTETTSLITVEDSAIYQVTCLDVHGCYVHNWQVITQATPPDTPIVSPSGTIHPCTADEGETITPVILHVVNYDDDLLWSSSETTQDIEVGYEDLLTVTYTDVESGCTSTSEGVLSIIGKNSIAPDSIRTNKPGNEVCKGDSITLTKYGGYLGEPLFEEETDSTFWAWYSDEDGDSLVGTGSSITVHPVEDTKYYLWAKGPCGMLYDSILIRCMSITLVSSDISCPGKINGTTRVHTLGGTAPYVYSWSQGLGGSISLMDLPAGFYGVVVTDSMNCSLYDSIEVRVPDSIKADINVSNSECHGATGSAKILASGGSSPYTYFWLPNGETSDSIGGLNANTYEVSIIDAKGCSIEKLVNISDSDGPVVEIDSLKNVTCNGLDDGYVSFQSTGPINSYPLCGILPNSLAAGNYPFVIEDSSGCKTVIDVEITEPQPIQLTINSTKSNCGDSSGTANVIVSGGISPYSYSWSSGGHEYFEPNLPSGIDTITVEDSHGCTNSTTITIVDSSALNIILDITSTVKCFNGNEGSVSAIVEGGTPPYRYKWSPPTLLNTDVLDSTSIIFHNSDTLENVQYGDYVVMVTDSNGCFDTAQIYLAPPPPLYLSLLSISPSADSTYDGNIIAEVSGGVSPYTYVWNGTDTSSSYSLENVGIGNYKVRVIDRNGCAAQEAKSFSPLNSMVGCGSNSGTITTSCITDPCATYGCCTLHDCATLSIMDFGAVGDGINDDECAFEAASDYILNYIRYASSALIPVFTLQIPYGTYLIGRQEYSSSRCMYLRGHNIFELDDCGNPGHPSIIIEGLPNGNGDLPELRYKPCMKFGAFDPVTGKRFLHCPNEPYCPSCTEAFGNSNWPCNLPDLEYAASLGNLFNITCSHRITLKNLDLNGNIDKMDIGGKFSLDNNGILLDHWGVYIYNSDAIVINTVNSHHFGMDGLVVFGYSPPPGIHFLGIGLRNSKFDRNCRNGFSWDSGSVINAYNCTFNFNAMGAYNVKPGAGIDFEWEGGQIVSNGIFTKCEFKFNKNAGIICDNGRWKNSQYNTHTDNTTHIRFNGCEFTSTELNGSNTIFSNGQDFTYNCCTFEGISSYPYDAYVLQPNDYNNYFTKFYNCWFKEKYWDLLNNISLSITSDNMSNPFGCSSATFGNGHPYLLNFQSDQSGGFPSRTLLSGCHIYTNYFNRLCRIFGRWAGGLNYNYVQIKNTRFNNDGLNCQGGNIPNLLGIFAYTTFSGYTLFSDPLNQRNAGGVYDYNLNDPWYLPGTVEPLVWSASVTNHQRSNTFPDAVISLGTCDVKNQIGMTNPQWNLMDCGSLSTISNMYLLDEFCLDPNCTSIITNDCGLPSPFKNQMNVKNLSSYLEVYPNPSTDVIYVNSSDSKYFILYDILGNEINRFINDKNESYPIIINNLNPGIYYIKSDLGITKFTKI